MTVDKDTLLKHRFWIALGGFALLWLIGLILIPVLQGSYNDTKVKAFDEAKKGVEAIPAQPKNDKFKEPLVQKEKNLKDKKLEVWGKVFKDYQANMSTWPRGGAAELEKLDEQPFGSFISLRDREEYGMKLYKDYVASLKLPELAAPVEFHGGWEKVIQPAKGWTVENPPSVEECWLAQEDLWVKRELLDVIKTTLDNVRNFVNVADSKEFPKREDLPEGSKRQVLRNGNWELDLITEPDPKSKEYVISAKSTIKNINSWKRTLSLADVKFRVRQGAADNFMDFAVPTDRVAWGETTDIKKAFAFGQLSIDPSKDLHVVQVLTWTSSPVKRIDALELGYNSHRTSNRVCKAKPIGTQKPAEDPSKSTTTTDPIRSGSSGGLPVSGPPPGSGLAGKGIGPGVVDKDAKSAVKRERYLDFTDQVRWMPIGMVLIVDQAYMQDIQTAVVNSRLRIQPTQIAFHRAYGVLPTLAAPDKKDKGDQPPPVDTQPRPPRGPGLGGPRMGRSMFPGSGYGPMSSPPGTGFPPFTGPGGPSSNLPGGDTAPIPEEDPNLVELSIYGIASLYERPPAKTAAPPAK
jgi:hypothetical protein